MPETRAASLSHFVAFSEVSFYAMASQGGWTSKLPLKMLSSGSSMSPLSKRTSSHLGCKCWCDFQGSEKCRPPSCFNHAKSLFNYALAPWVVVIEASLDLSIHWLFVGCDQADWGVQTRIVPITQNNVPYWGIPLCPVKRTVSQYSCVTNKPWIANQYVYESSTGITYCLHPNGIKPLVV